MNRLQYVGWKFRFIAGCFIRAQKRIDAAGTVLTLMILSFMMGTSFGVATMWFGVMK